MRLRWKSNNKENNMIKGIDLSKNIAITASKEIQAICRPLYKYWDITYFNYVKINPDGSRSTLTDRPDFITRYYKDKELFSTKAVLKMETVERPSFHLSCEFRDQLSYVVARNDYNIDNGLTIIQPCGKSTELYYFGTTKNNYTHTNIYLNNVDVFYRFVSFFKERAEKLIKQADQQKFYLPFEDDDIIKPSNLSDKDTTDLRKCFFEATKINRYFVGYGSNTTLTRREAECLYYLMHNKSAKEIAQALDLSSRTIETHLSNVKLKLDCHTKKDTVKQFLNTELGRMLNYSFAELDQQIDK